MYIEKIFTVSDKQDVSNFLQTLDLKYDQNIDCTLIAKENEKIIATISKEKNIIKCFGIHPSFQNQGIANILLTNIVDIMFSQSYTHYFVFTKRENTNLFVRMGFSEIAHTNKTVLLEMGNSSIDIELSSLRKKYSIDNSKKNAAIVMNCNPFTLGHLFLIEKASKEEELVLIFVVQEDSSYFSFNDRYELVLKGVSHLKNVEVIPSTEYIISSATFPTYFLKKQSEIFEEYPTLDATIFGKYFSKYFNIYRRYVGTEPLSQITNKYNEKLKEILPLFEIELIEIERREIESMPISASEVRRLFFEKKFNKLQNLVPLSTYNYLINLSKKEK